MIAGSYKRLASELKREFVIANKEDYLFLKTREKIDALTPKGLLPNFNRTLIPITVIPVFRYEMLESIKEKEEEEEEDERQPLLEKIENEE